MQDDTVAPHERFDEDPADHLATLLGAAVRSMRPIGGGGFGRPYRAEVELSSGSPEVRQLFVKVGEPLPGAFAAEAAGLRALGSVDGGAGTAEVLGVDDRMLVLNWIDEDSSTSDAAAEFGRRLAITHRSGAPGFGREADTVIASEVLPAGSGCHTWPDFYASARLRPFIDRAVSRGRLAAADRQSLLQVIDRLPELAGPQEPPALLHGDLWSGNVLWSEHGAVLIDPACYGGHRETDLAMLALFGLPHLEIVLDSYQAEYPLAPGWRQRIGLHQLFPLLVHAVIFGGSYGRAAGDSARHCLSL